MGEPRNICTETWCIQNPSGAAERINDLEEANNEYNVEIERRKIEKASMQVRIASLEAALNIIASGFKGDKVLADWEMSNIAAAAVAK